MGNITNSKAAADAVMSLIEVLVQKGSFTFSDFSEEINKLLEEKIKDESN